MIRAGVPTHIFLHSCRSFDCNPSLRSSSTSLEVSEILQGTKAKEDATKIVDANSSALVTGALVAPVSYF